MQLDDLLFALHGLGPRYARVQTVVADGKPASYAYLDFPDTTYDIVTAHDKPILLGSLDELAQAQNGKLYLALDMAFRGGPGPRRGRDFATKQQMALALIKAMAEGVVAGDQVAAYRIARWAKVYERRSWWLTKHRAEAFTKEAINWVALGL